MASSKKTVRTRCAIPYLALCALLGFSNFSSAMGASARYSADYLIQLYRGDTLLAPLAPGADSIAAKAAAKQAAQGYIAGTVDAGEGVRWCVNQSFIPPKELDEQLIQSLVKNAKQQSNAAMLLGIELSKRFPCKRAAKK
jgi:hypothetical protein